MSYLLDKKIKRKKFVNIALGVLFLGALLYFRVGVFGALSSVSQTLFRPVLAVGRSAGEKIKSVGSYFASKNSLYLQNQNLLNSVKENDARMANYDSVVAENARLKEILGRKKENLSLFLASILAKPNQSPYDTLVIDAGAKQGLREGSLVFAFGDLPIGRVGLVYDNSAKVILFSSAGEKTQAIISGQDVFMELVGRGGGNFEMILPRDFVIKKGDQVVMPGASTYLLAIAETTISDPRDPFLKALLVSPVNMQALKFVEVER
jgi:cell shape-determining protein MreC